MVIPTSGVPERMAKEKPLPQLFLLGVGLVLFFFYLIIWSMVWHLVLLPHARPDNHQLRIESSAPHRVDKTFLFFGQTGFLSFFRLRRLASPQRMDTTTLNYPATIMERF